MSEPSNRRPIKARGTATAQHAARVLSRAGVSANAISLSSVVFAALAALCLLLAPSSGSVFYLLAALLCPLRLVANLLDGMVAVEERKGTATGPIYNELPDRIADVAILAALGHAGALAALSGPIAIASPIAGWLAAVAALMTAYVRELGRALGAPSNFSGPMAKQQRMWVVVAAALACAALPAFAGAILCGAAVLIAAGSALTAALRTRRLAAHLRRG